MNDLDQALVVFHKYGYEYGDGTPNYGPMAAAALVELGHEALIQGIVDIYAARLSPIRIGNPLSREAQPEVLGRREAFADWVATHRESLSQQPWPQVVASEVRRLAEGLGRASFHALVRTGHAVTSLEAEENVWRRDELAFGLAHWSASYEPTGEAPTSDATRAAGDSDSEPVDLRLERACRAGADHYLDHLDRRMQNVHWVTAPSALRRLAKHLESSTLERAWAALRRARLVVEFGADAAPVEAARVDEAPREDARVDEEVARCAESRDEIRYRAACSIQEHAITFATACLREDAARPDARLRSAAADGALHLSPPGYREWR